MNIYGFEQYVQLNSVKCEHSLFNLVASYARELGFNCCTFVLRMPLPLTKRNVSVFSNCSLAKKNRYRRIRGCQFDFTKIDSAARMVKSNDFKLPVDESWNGTCLCGRDIVWSHTARDANGVAGTLILGCSDKSLSYREIQNLELDMLCLAHMTHTSMSKILTVPMMPEAGVKLTEREIEVLRWIADGKTSAETSQILNISERTVNFHIANAMEKFNSTNKTAAVVRAATLGLLNY